MCQENEDVSLTSAASIRMSPHERSEIQSGAGLASFSGMVVPPASNHLHSSGLILLSFI